MIDRSSKSDKSKTASLKERKPESDRRILWKSTVIPDSLKKRHRPNKAHESPSEKERLARSGCALCAMNKSDEGIKTRTEQSWNARNSMRFNWEFDSNEMDESDLQPEKQHDRRISTVRGITMD
jgi:hypothetical protein